MAEKRSETKVGLRLMCRMDLLKKGLKRKASLSCTNIILSQGIHKIV